MSTADGREISRLVHMSPRRALAVAAGAVVLLVAVLHLLGSGRIEPGLLTRGPQAAPNEPVAVVTAELVPRSLEVIGSVQSRVQVDAGSRVTATVREVRVRAGGAVKRGQVLVILDSADLRAHVGQAQGELEAARAELTRTTADEKRFSALYSRGSVTQRESETAQAAYRAARASVSQAVAAVAAARAALAYATVASPVDGIVTERLIEPGDLAVTGQPMVRLYDESALRVQLEMPEDVIGQVKLGMPLDVRIDATGARVRTAVNEIVPEANPSSRSFFVRAPLRSGRGLRPGMFARATFAVGTEKILTIPRTAPRSVGQLDTVQVISAGAVEMREVSVGRTIGDRIEVLAGLNEGDKVLLTRPEPNHR